MNLANIMPPAVAKTNEKAPSAKISIELGVRNTSAWVEAPTVRPISIVTISIREVLAVSARRLVTPDSRRRFPKNNIPSKGRALGVIKRVINNPIIGNSIFSTFETALGGFILIFLSSIVVEASLPEAE